VLVGVLITDFTSPERRHLRGSSLRKNNMSFTDNNKFRSIAGGSSRNRMTRECFSVVVYDLTKVEDIKSVVRSCDQGG
jgi:hypothetical protein